MNSDQNRQVSVEAVPIESDLNIHIEDALASSICSNCSEVSDCRQRMYVEQPILFCEGHRTKEISHGNSDSTQLVLTIKDTEDRQPPALNQEGLCLNCTNKENCGWEKAGNTIWYCEEYL